MSIDYHERATRYMCMRAEGQLSHLTEHQYRTNLEMIGVLWHGPEAPGERRRSKRFDIPIADIREAQRMVAVEAGRAPTQCIGTPQGSSKWWADLAEMARFRREREQSIAESIRTASESAEMREAQRQADRDGVPVKVIINGVADGEVVTRSHTWVHPLETAGQWTIAREPGGREVPVRVGSCYEVTDD